MAAHGPDSKYDRIKQKLEDYLAEKEQNFMFQGWSADVKAYLDGDFATLPPENDAVVSASVLSFCDKKLWTIASAAGATTGSTLKIELVAIANETLDTNFIDSPSPYPTDEESEGDEPTQGEAAEDEVEIDSHKATPLPLLDTSVAPAADVVVTTAHVNTSDTPNGPGMFFRSLKERAGKAVDERAARKRQEQVERTKRNVEQELAQLELVPNSGQGFTRPGAS